MVGPLTTWDPASSQCWAALLGLVPVPMFRTDNPSHPGKHDVLLDGPRGSFAFSVMDDIHQAQSNAPVSWAWSSNVRHALIVTPRDGLLYMRRWDDPGLIRRFKLPTRGQIAVDLFGELQRSQPRGIDAVKYVLGIFRVLRDAFRDEDVQVPLRLLNGLLLLAGRAQRDSELRGQIEIAATFAEAYEHLTKPEQNHVGFDAIPPRVLSHEVHGFLSQFLQPDPRTGCELHADLLLRHAASQLYQEAHLLIERDPQRTFFGMGTTEDPTGVLPRDTRFTPPNLARALAQRALDAFDPSGKHTDLTILDPACGSGIFLQECLRELVRRGHSGRITLTGYDKSPIATALCKFCLSVAAEDLADLKVVVDVKCMDSLQEDWTQADLILMNPPFVAVDELGEDFPQVKNILGPAAKGRIDKAMAFVTKAVAFLRPGGVVASVLPAPLLETQSGLKWREALSAACELLLLGRFEGYGYFTASMVETAFLVMRRPVNESRTDTVEVVVASEGSEDAALRSMRLDPTFQTDPSAEVFTVPSDFFKPLSWMPLPRKAYEMREVLAKAPLPTVSDIFLVRQGIRTGDNRAFLLDSAERAALPAGEREFFRPAAGQGTILKGTLHDSLFVFYPYGPEGAIILSEPDLRRMLPEYYERKLCPREAHLRGRPKMRDWWLLTRERSWQWKDCPKLVTTYFGLPGCFAYDETGEFAVVQGYAWLWKKFSRREDASDLQCQMVQTPLPWAYSAIGNSRVFASILASYCPRVQGGQFDLSTRFVQRVPMPDFRVPKLSTDAVVSKLERLGHQIQDGCLSDIADELDQTVASAYHLPRGMASEWLAQ